jgi:hypothetical protein
MSDGTCAVDEGYRNGRADMTNPYLEPVSPAWVRAAGVILLAAALALTAAILWEVWGYLGPAAPGRAFNSSTLIFGLILIALCGMCWQAGYRLAFGRPDRTGTLFSRPAWFAIGTGLLVITLLMAVVIARGRGLNLLDVQFMLFFGGIGVWCLVLAFKRAANGR